MQCYLPFPPHSKCFFWLRKTVCRDGWVLCWLLFTLLDFFSGGGVIWLGGGILLCGVSRVAVIFEPVYNRPFAQWPGHRHTFLKGLHPLYLSFCTFRTRNSFKLFFSSLFQSPFSKGNPQITRWCVQNPPHVFMTNLVIWRQQQTTQIAERSNYGSLNWNFFFSPPWIFSEIEYFWGGARDTRFVGYRWGTAWPSPVSRTAHIKADKLSEARLIFLEVSFEWCAFLVSIGLLGGGLEWVHTAYARYRTPSGSNWSPALKIPLSPVIQAAENARAQHMGLEKCPYAAPGRTHAVQVVMWSGARKCRLLCVL